jgi:two-component system sensor histidine kinase TctE
VPKALAKHIDLGVEIELIQLIISGNALLIEEMLNNLLDNALTYNETGTKITVTLSQSDHLATLIVEDNGLGIPITEHEKVFQRFHRVLSNGRTGGCGLGLAIVLEIMQLHNGVVYVKFTNVEKQSGTSVHCEFPLCFNDVTGGLTVLC